MHLRELKLSNFRNYFELSISFKKELNVFIGENAQGKTNLLEAIHYIYSLQSFRTQEEKSLIKAAANEAFLSAVVERGSRAVNISVMLDEKGKRARVNNKKVNKASEFLTEFHAITFSPDDLFLIKDQPSERRKYFDRAILPHSPGYLKTLNKYDRILEHRNRLLKDMRDGKRGSEAGLLKLWDEQFVEEGARVLLKREQFVEELKPFLEKTFSALSKGQKKLSIFYEASILPADEKFSEEIEGPDAADKIKSRFRDALKEKREDEQRCGYTLVGPHRDDFQFAIDDQRAKATASQGQHRLAILALKLSEAALYKERFGEYPILLLDDVFSELDETRGEALIGQILDMNIEQAFITAAKKESIPSKKERCSFYLIKEGTVRQYS